MTFYIFWSFFYQILFDDVSSLSWSVLWRDCFAVVSILALLTHSAAFDMMDHVILSHHLFFTFGCTEAVLGYFESYLSNHMQSVLGNDVSLLH